MNECIIIDGEVVEPDWCFPYVSDKTQKEMKKNLISSCKDSVFVVSGTTDAQKKNLRERNLPVDDAYVRFIDVNDNHFPWTDDLRNAVEAFQQAVGRWVRQCQDFSVYGVIEYEEQSKQINK